MISDSALISVCIPAYNRAQFLSPLLDSILKQNFEDFEIIICEDNSPQREEIRKIAREYENRDVNIRYIENEQNLGYDANFRNLLAHARGQYCFFMGNDDLMAEGALVRVAEVVQSNAEIGIILRAYSWFISDPEKPEQTIRFFGEDRIFDPGERTIATAFRRCGVLSGFVIDRLEARRFDTTEYDGFLFYQMYLCACILMIKRAYYINQVLTLSRATEAPDFGNSEEEKKIFTPGQYTPQARLHMLKGMLTIAKGVQKKYNISIYKAIENDIANYILPYIADQTRLPVTKYFRLYRNLSMLGFGRYPMFHAYSIGGYVLKEKGFHKLANAVRHFFRRTPRLGRFYEGKKV